MNSEEQKVRDKRKQSLKKLVVFAVMIAIFAGSLWLIFAPSGKDKANKAKAAGSGLNVDIPDPKGEIEGDKITAYQQEEMEKSRSEKMRSLADFSGQAGDNLPQTSGGGAQVQGQQMPQGDDHVSTDGRPVREMTPAEIQQAYERQVSMAPKPTDWDDQRQTRRAPGTASNSGSNPVAAHANAYRDITETMRTFYDQPKDDPEKDEMKQKLEQLQAQVDAQNNAAPKGNDFDQQVALMEKSYQLAAKYAPGGQGQAQAAPQQKKPPVAPVQQVGNVIVSTLSQPMSNAEFIRQMAQVRNLGFNTPTQSAEVVERNTIGAVVQGQQTVVDGQCVRLRLTEPVQAGPVRIPANSVVTGMAKIQGERLDITVTAVEYQGQLIPVELTAYDTDGQRGIYIPGSLEIEAVKEIAANAGSSLGSSINISQQKAGEQLLTDLGRGVIQGTSAYISKKIQQVKVTIKSGYKVLLLPSNDNNN